jgi:hypothetical protein
MNKSLMGLGNQIIGVTRDREAAEVLARYYCRYDPYFVKKYEPVWMSDFGRPFVVDHRSVEFTPEEQFLIYSYRFTDLKRFEFQFSPAVEEGSISTVLKKVSIDWFDKGLYPEMDVMEDARKKLMQRSGQPIEDILAEIDRRRPRYLLKDSQQDDRDDFPAAEVRK